MAVEPTIAQELASNHSFIGREEVKEQGLSGDSKPDEDSRQQEISGSTLVADWAEETG
ncbi:unnamed protein product [Closterium sp. NIES-53]